MLSYSSSLTGVVHIGQVAGFEIFLKSASGLLPGGWVGLKSFGYRCHFRAFQLELDTLDIQNIGNGPVVAKLQLFEVEQLLQKSKKFNTKSNENPSFPVQNLKSYDFSSHFWDPQ